jgi:hypothetical protein
MQSPSSLSSHELERFLQFPKKRSEERGGFEVRIAHW